MKQAARYFFCALLITCVVPVMLGAQSLDLLEKRKREATRQLNFTYAGPVAGFGFNSIKHRDWFDDTNMRETRSISGQYFSGGCMFYIIAKNITGDFSLRYLYNANDDDTLWHFSFAASGKYLHPLSEVFSLAGGLGMYIETGPANKAYSGSAGVQVPVGVVVTTSHNTRLIFDIIGKYGYYGLGEDSRKLSYGINLGFLFKVGRI